MFPQRLCHPQGRLGAMLVLALFFIVAVTSLAVLIMANTSQSMRTSRSEHEWILVRDLTDSALAWVVAHKGLGSETAVTLNGKELLPEGTSGEVRISLDDESAGVLVISATLTFPSRSLTHTTRFQMASQPR